VGIRDLASGIGALGVGIAESLMDWDIVGSLGTGLILAFYAGCALIFIALIVWAYRYLFG
jgi:hypothetical protein